MMTDHENGDAAASYPRSRPEERLRADLLTSGLTDVVPMIEVETVILNFKLAETLSDRQNLALKTIRSLLEDGLMEIGELPGPNEKFPAWNLSIDEAMERLYDLYVAHYDEEKLWEFRIWLHLTEAGQPVAKTLLEAKKRS
jgi:hypothetical protein